MQTSRGISVIRWNRRRFIKAVGAGLGAWTLAGPRMIAQQGPLKIGVLAPLQITLPVGQSLVRAAQIATEEINASGGIAGRQITIQNLIRDDLDLTKVRANFEELIVEQKVSAVIGGFLDESTTAVMPAIERLAQNKLAVPFLNSGSSGPAFTLNVKNNYNAYKTYFRVMVNSDILSQDTATMAVNLIGKRLNLKKFALLIEDGEFGRAFQAFVDKRLKDAGLEVVYNNRFDLNLNNFDPIVDQIVRAKAEVILPAFARHNGVTFVQSLAGQDVAIPVLGINVDGQAFEYFERTNKKIESHVYIDAATDATAITPKTLPFFRSYLAKRAANEPSRPLYTAFTTYDAFYIFKDAVERTKGDLNPDKLVTALEESNYVGTIGTIKFRGREDQYPHEPIYTPDLVAAKWTQWRRNSKDETVRTVVYPEEYRTSSFISAGLLEPVADRIKEKDSIDGVKLNLDISSNLTAENGAFAANASATVNALTLDRKLDAGKTANFKANSEGGGSLKLPFAVSEDALVRVTVGSNAVNVVARK
jgi:branched-chain amino acid transport system substrate-binding protein